MLRAYAISILRTLREAGHQAYLVGGCVRDLLLGCEPADYDVSTDATPNQVMQLFPTAYAVGAQFGVVLVPAPRTQTDGAAEPFISSHMESGRESAVHALAGHPGVVEVATFRSDL